MRQLLVLAAVVGVWAGQAPAQDTTYSIKLRREDQPGDKKQVATTKAEAVKTAFSAGGQEQAKDEKKSTKLVFTQEVLERPAGADRPTKLVRTYETAERTKDGKTEQLPYHGKKLTIERKDKKYTFAVDGAELAGPDAEELDQEFNKKAEAPPKNEDFLPGRPVKLNEEWTVDPGKFVKSFETETPFRLDPDKTKITGKLTKAYKKGDVQYGVLDLDLALATKALSQGGMELPLKEGSKFHIKLVIDTCIDGTTQDDLGTATTDVGIKADLPNGGNLSIAGNVVQKTTAKLVAKK
jgi:hypothetical protein